MYTPHMHSSMRIYIHPLIHTLACLIESMVSNCFSHVVISSGCCWPLSCRSGWSAGGYRPTLRSGGWGFEVLWQLNYAGLLIFGARPQSMLVGVVGEWAVWSVAGW